MSDSIQPPELKHIHPYAIARGIDTRRRNMPCPCGSTKKAKKCCFTGENVSKNWHECKRSWIEEIRAKREARIADAKRAAAETF